MEKLVIIPEFILFEIVNNALKYLRKDYNDAQNKDDSYLHKILFGNSIERYDLTQQAKQVFIDNDEANQRFLEVHLMFNMKREGLPTIHITLPSEQTQSGGNGLGTDEGYKDYLITDSEYNDDELVKQGNITPVYTRRYQSTYNIVITSDNSNEVILIYHTLRSILTSLIPSIHLSGLQNIAFGGQDVQLLNGVPNQMYVRSLSATLQYETSVPNIFPSPLMANLIANGVAVNS